MTMLIATPTVDGPTALDGYTEYKAVAEAAEGVPEMVHVLLSVRPAGSVEEEKQEVIWLPEVQDIGFETKATPTRAESGE